jgi:aspartyl aminopeptidase
MGLPVDADDAADGLIEYLRASPSPFHACQQAARLLTAAGFTAVTETRAFPAEPGRYFLIRGGSLVAWSTEHAAGPATPLRVVGAHTDSPNLRVKPRPDLARAGWRQLGVEVYGGPLLNSWLDRDLGLSGRVSLRADSTGDAAESVEHPGAAAPAGVHTRLLHIDEPILRISQLAIHLDRSVNSEGVTLNPQQHLAPIWGLESTAPQGFRQFVADRLDVHADAVLGWDLMTHDTAPPRRIGASGELIAGGRLDNLATSYAGTRALIAASGRRPAQPLTRLLVLFDHEEVGSVSERGAYSALLPAVLERMVLAAGGSRDDYHRALAGTVIASGDMAHATHPNYAERHEPQHQITVGGGPVLKINNNLRYATGAPGAAAFVLACEQAGVPVQHFVTRSDLPCGSTVGPMTAALTGAQTVDFGAPMLSMHSARELTGVADQAMYVAALTAFLDPAA